MVDRTWRGVGKVSLDGQWALYGLYCVRRKRRHGLARRPSCAVSLLLNHGGLVGYNMSCPGALQTATLLILLLCIRFPTSILHAILHSYNEGLSFRRFDHDHR